MIEYDGGQFQLAIVCQLHGSVFPKACVFAVPATLVAIVFHIMTKDVEEFKLDLTIMENSAAYSGFSFVVGFLLVFRTSQAYTRFWEGTTLMQLLRGQWVGAFSSILAFTSTSTVDQQAIEDFRHKLVRLFSLLHASALRYAATLSEDLEEFEIIGVLGLDDNTINFIHDTGEDTKIYVTIQWIQQLILANLNTGILPVPAPIISRVFQDLSTGIVTLNNARKISDTPFPFPYVQIMSLMLLMHMAITPFVVVTWCTEWYWSAILTFVPVFAFWSINYIAAEIEQPFGGDCNDINVADLQTTMNRSLVAMLHPQVSNTPELKMTAEFDRTNLIDKADTLSVAYDVIQRRESALKTVKPSNRQLVSELLKLPPSRQSWTYAEDTEPSALRTRSGNPPQQRMGGATAPAAESVPAEGAATVPEASAPAGPTAQPAAGSSAASAFTAPALGVSAALAVAQLAALKELSDHAVVEPNASLDVGELEFLQKPDPNESLPALQQAAERDLSGGVSAARGAQGIASSALSLGGGSASNASGRGGERTGDIFENRPGETRLALARRFDPADCIAPGRPVDGPLQLQLSVDTHGFSLRMDC